MANLPRFEFTLISTNDQLADVAKHWHSVDVLALDTEFIRRTTYYPVLGLIQVYDGNTIYLIDPIDIDDYTPLADVFTNTAVLKLLHSASEDLEVFQRYIGCLPSPLLDSQIAASMAGVGLGLGFNKLVMALLEVDLPKDETCSDWLQRPLSDKQCQYACADVHYLFEMYTLLRDKLEQQQRLDWAMADSATDGKVVPSEVPLEEYYLRVNGIGKLNRTELAVFQQLCKWRERLVRKKDVPRGRFVKDAALLKIARRIPKDFMQLASLKELQPGILNHYGDELVSIINKAKDLPEESKPAALPPPLLPAQKPLVDKLKQCLQEVAEQLDFPVELLASRKDLVALVASSAMGGYTLPAKFGGWREQLVGDKLLAYLQEEG